MALWAGSSFATNEATMVVNKMLTDRAVPMVEKKNAFLRKIIGKRVGGRGTTASPWQYERVMFTSGKDAQVNLLGRAPEPATLADGSAEIAASAPNYYTNMFGAATFPLTHYLQEYAIPKSEMMRFRGDDARTKNYLLEVMDAMIIGTENKLATDMHSTTGTSVASRTVFNSWEFGVSDGSTDSSADAFKLYGTLDRSDAANADFEAIVVDKAAAVITLADIDYYLLQVDANGGDTDLGLTGSSVYASLYNQAKAYITVENAGKERLEVGNRTFTYAGVEFLHDSRTASGRLGLLDTSHWVFVVGDSSVSTSEVLPAPHLKSTEALIKNDFFATLVCKKPNTQLKVINAGA